MTTGRPARRITTLWELVWNGDRLRCAVYRCGTIGPRVTRPQFELRLQSGAKTLFSEPFDLGPKAVSRTEALRRSLKRRGWREEHG